MKPTNLYKIMDQIYNEVRYQTWCYDQVRYQIWCHEYEHMYTQIWEVVWKYKTKDP